MDKLERAGKRTCRKTRVRDFVRGEILDKKIWLVGINLRIETDATRTKEGLEAEWIRRIAKAKAELTSLNIEEA